ncbi:flagella associated protein [Achlya hypogyna]|uniref:Flagella associated protein n=1 Tax=Achlya hypogyna TaxID=1202772 RepID=A0A1V9YYG1_ACHHY|nr:flagella associated protein [Achlya hypogyna]
MAAERAYGYDFVYLKTTVGNPLSEALAQLALDQPEDPIEYVGKYLLKYVANEKKRHERAGLTFRRKTDQQLIAEEEAKRNDAIRKLKLAHDEALIAENTTRELLQKTDDVDVLCNLVISKLLLATGAGACYIGRKVTDGEGVNFIEWFAASEGSECVLGQSVSEETGFTYDALREVEDPNAQADEDGNLPPPAVPPFIHVENVIREPRIKYFGIPCMGAYLVRGLKYNSYLHDDIVQVSSETIPTLEAWLVIAVDTLGQARPFSPDNIEAFSKWSSAFADAMEQYEKRTYAVQVEWKRAEEKDTKNLQDELKDAIQLQETRIATAVDAVEDENVKVLQEATMKAAAMTDLISAKYIGAVAKLAAYLIPFKLPVLRTLAAVLYLVVDAPKETWLSATTKLPTWDKVRGALAQESFGTLFAAFSAPEVNGARIQEAKDILGETALEDVESPSFVVGALHAWLQAVFGAVDALAEAKAREAEKKDDD